MCLLYVIKCSSCFQYIFGDFSPDEFNQFFVTPRSSVEVRKNFFMLICVKMIDSSFSL